MKEDNRNLRERNYQLHDDNMRLKDELSDLRKSLELVDSARKSYQEEARKQLTKENLDRKGWFDVPLSLMLQYLI